MLSVLIGPSLKLVRVLTNSRERQVLRVFIRRVDDNISGSLKSYIDSTATPGVSYEYKVTATTATGTQALASTAYKVSKPFIYLVPPNKTITGKVRDDLNASISGAEVVAVNMMVKAGPTLFPTIWVTTNLA